MIVRAHQVAVAKIIEVQPLVRNSQLLSPDCGLKLVCSDGRSQTWLAEKEKQSVPAVGDFLVYDDHIHVTYVVSAEIFSSMFAPEKENESE